MRCTCKSTERSVTNVLFLAERPRLDVYTFTWIAGLTLAGLAIAVSAILLATWWCVRYLVGGSYRGGGR